jgi:4-amino-4-deoxy-L-arabinose transferase-like glycosyltransferase
MKPKDTRQKPHSKEQPPKEIARKSLAARITGLVIIFILAAIPFAIGRYCELKFPDPYDSAAYVYSAEHVLQGGVIGVDESPSAQPGTLLVNMLGVKLFGFSEFGPKLIQTTMQAIALLLMFYTMRRLYGTLAAAVGVIIASVYLSAPLIAKFGNVKEQHMIAFMVIGVCCFTLRQLGGKWWLAVLSGAALSWAPLFKPTGVSAIAAVGVFLIAQPFFKHRTIKQTFADIGLLVVGFIAAVAPIWVWLIARHNANDYLPYMFIFKPIISRIIGHKQAGGTLTSYVSSAREVFGLAKQWPIVTRYYATLVLPIIFAALALFARLVRSTAKLCGITTREEPPSYERFVLLFSVWWLCDMALVWVSPRSYEQYYLPLNASAAMLGGYLVALYRDKAVRSNYHPGWIITGVLALLVMIAMSWHIFFGIKVSPFSGQPYDGPSRGYAQRLEEVRQFDLGEKMPWQEAGDYIREHTVPGDKIYVWGWFPGIYVRSQRLSSASSAFESEMHTMAPQALEQLVGKLLTEFKKEPPKFIVDSRKYEFPWDRPPLPLWPTDTKYPLNTQRAWYDFSFVQGSDEQIDKFDQYYAQRLANLYKDGEAERYMAMKPLRNYIRHNYKIVGMFGQHVLFELKTHTTPKL